MRCTARAAAEQAAKHTPAPSLVSKNTTVYQREQRQHPIYNGRGDRIGPSVKIHNTAFGTFATQMENLDTIEITDLSGIRMDDIADLLGTSSSIFLSEDERVEPVSKYLQSLLGVPLLRLTLSNKWKADGSAIKLTKDARKEAVYVVYQGKPEPGLNGDAGLQASLTYRDHVFPDIVRVSDPLLFSVLTLP